MLRMVKRSLRSFIFLLTAGLVLFPLFASGEVFFIQHRVNLSINAGPTIVIEKGVWGDYLPNLNASLRADYRFYRGLYAGMEFLFIAGGGGGFILPHVIWEFYKGIYGFIGGGFVFMEDIELIPIHFIRGPQIGMGWRTFLKRSNLFLRVEYNILMDLHKFERRKDFFGNPLNKPIVEKYHFILNQFVIGLGYAF